ncbi:general transcription factor 3C polypeptide 2 [Thalassophryne amazonica]|uniref:general transcription factor 3C polypeptide 2 n=1 Tax=Thalassophryne amazonica TaxID=390379 RepID=UPI0014709E85|nr:general transcription factor 3C polypeptide 2 [Thalassophryne amazonica]
MEATDSEQEQRQPAEQLRELVPTSSGRQRKRNVKYLDYEMDGTWGVQPDEQDLPKKSPRASSQKCSGAKISPKKTADGDQEAMDKIPQTSVRKTSKKTERKTPKKCVSKKTPVKPAAEAELPGGESGAAGNVQQENGLPKPKRKYVKKQRVQQQASDTDPAGQEVERETQTEREEETPPGGRPRRGAAKAALKYLHSFAKELLSHSGDDGIHPECVDGTSTEGSDPRSLKERRYRKKKRFDSPGDVDFVPCADEDDFDSINDEEDEDQECDRANVSYSSSKELSGITADFMKVASKAATINKIFRDEHHSSSVFPDWVPNVGAWQLLPHSDLEEYLPQELQSVAFRVSREGLTKDKEPLTTLHRFEAVPAHPDRWDMLLYAGGPVWATEWCPTPDGVPAAQYIALACHRQMDDLHCVNELYAEPGLIQLWDVGTLLPNRRPSSQPVLAYGLVQDKGFIWQLKWCPSGAWELPSSSRKAPFLPRLGLLAAATSTGVVTIYSLPHPEALHIIDKPPDSGEVNRLPPIYKAKGVLTLKLGAFKAPHHEQSGQVLSMDWLPIKPHNIIAVGFYDGVVGLWNLSTRSALLRVREKNQTTCLLPYRCFVAHGNAVRALAFCPAFSHLLVTAGEDRQVKMWDLRSPYEPVTVQKRYLTTEICWPLNAPGLLLSQENAYAGNTGHGIHYYDHNMGSLFVIPRSTTVWSLSCSGWLNSVTTADMLGEVICAVLPPLYACANYNKWTRERRFPVYFTDMMPYDTNTAEEESQEMGGLEEGDEGRERLNAEQGAEEGSGRKENEPPKGVQHLQSSSKEILPPVYRQQQPFGKELAAPRSVERMKKTEVTAGMNMDVMPLAAVHKVRLSPNLSSCTWLASGGQAGLVRLHSLTAMSTSYIQKQLRNNQAQTNAVNTPEVQNASEQPVSHLLQPDFNAAAESEGGSEHNSPHCTDA